MTRHYDHDGSVNAPEPPLSVPAFGAAHCLQATTCAACLLLDDDILYSLENGQMVRIHFKECYPDLLQVQLQLVDVSFADQSIKH